MENCTKCGSPIEDYQKRCPACGAELTQNAENNRGIGKKISSISLIFSPNRTVGAGKCGDDVYWELNAGGTLTLRGTGAMYTIIGAMPTVVMSRGGRKETESRRLIFCPELRVSAQGRSVNAKILKT